MFSVHTTGNDEEATYAIRFSMPGVEGTWTLRECPVKFAGHDAAYMAGVARVQEVLVDLFAPKTPHAEQ